MSATTSRMFLLVEPPTAYLRFQGRAAVEGARDFKDLIRRLQRDGIRQFVLDLSDCKLMDSTFSGVLAALADETAPVSATGVPTFTLVNPNARVTDLLENLGVLPLVRVLQESGASLPGGTGGEVPTPTADRTATAECCLDAHRFLMTLKPENRGKFQAVVSTLEAQLAPSRP